MLWLFRTQISWSRKYDWQPLKWNPHSKPVSESLSSMYFPSGFINPVLRFAAALKSYENNTITFSFKFQNVILLQSNNNNQIFF